MKTPFVQYYMQQCLKIVFKLSNSDVPVSIPEALYFIVRLDLYCYC